LSYVPICTCPQDEDDWRSWTKVGDEVVHIELRRWADVLIIAPLSANSLAKLAHGLCDNLLMCVARAWDFSRPILASSSTPRFPPQMTHSLIQPTLQVAPAMNTAMYEHPLTSRQLTTLTDLGVHVIPPVSKRLACGDVGTGAMASPTEISTLVARALTASLNPSVGGCTSP
jgi:phosphopantothenoylcysteine decarboxylase